MGSNTNRWSDRMTVRLKQLCLTTDLPYREIAIALGREFGRPITKNAVIGRAHRHKIPPRPPRRDMRPPADRRPRTGPMLKPKPPRQLQPLPLPPPQPNPGSVTLLDLRAGDCRWPENDGDPFLFCGRSTTKGPYCPTHAKIAGPA